jgi:hypothetical protein
MFRRKATPTEVARKQLAEAGRDFQRVGKKAAEAARMTVRDVTSTRDAKRVVKHQQATQEAARNVAKIAMEVGRRRAKDVANSKEMKQARISARKAADAAKVAAQASSSSAGANAQTRLAVAQARATAAAAASKAQARSLRAARKTTKV